MEFVNLLRDHGIETSDKHHHARSGWIQIDCPWCSKGSRKFRLGYNLAKNYLNCWTCGYHNLVETFAELAEITIKESTKLLRQVERPVIRKETTLQGKLKNPSGIGPLTKRHRNYLTGRGFDPDELVRLWNVAGIGLHSRLSWRIFIPIYLEGKQVSWTTRAVEGSSRYISASPAEESLPHKTLLFGEDYARNAIVIHEGPFDVFRTGPGAVATLGTSYTRKQLLRMSKYPVRVVCFDSSKDAQDRAKTLAKELMGFPGETWNVKLSGKDAAESPDSEIKELRKFLK